MLTVSLIMCLSGEVSDNWPPLIEFIVFLIFGGLDIGAHYGVYLISKTEIFDITRHAVYNVSRPNNTLSTLNYTLTTLNNTINATLSGSNRTIMNNTNISPFMNITRSPEELWADLIEFRKLYFYAWIIGAVIFGIQVCWLLPNVVKHIMSADPAVLKDGSAPWYYRNVFTVHVLFLLLGTFLFDIPISCLTMEMLSLVWKGEALTAQEKLSASETMFTLSLVGLAFIAFYKGSFFGNCTFNCIYSSNIRLEPIIVTCKRNIEK